MSRETANAARYAKGLCVLSDLEGELLEALEACQKELNAHITARNMTAVVDDLHDYQTVHEAAIAIAKAHGNP